MTVWPTNDPALVDEIIKTIGAKGDEPVKGPNGETTLREALLSRLPHHPNDAEIFESDRGARGQRRAVAHRAAQAGTETGPRHLSLGNGGDRFSDRASVDQMDAAGIRRHCWRNCMPRLYSISSSLKAHPEPGAFHDRRRALRKPRPTAQRRLLHLSGRARGQMCRSRFFQTRRSSGCPKTATRRSSWSDRAPGSRRSAPYLQERKAIGAKGKNWLFFGSQHEHCNYFYRDEFEQYEERRISDPLDCAWSRDQAGKIYVQDKMLENARPRFGNGSMRKARTSLCAATRGAWPRMSMPRCAKSFRNKAARAKSRRTNTSRN